MVQTAAFNEGAELAALRQAGVGGIASFTGIVRMDGNAAGSKLQSLYLDHYPGMTEAALSVLAGEAVTRWSLLSVTVIHRVGVLKPSDPIVFVGTAAAHRAAALESCTFLIDRLKTDAPFWKKESFSDGAAKWVTARESDEAATLRWA